MREIAPAEIDIGEISDALPRSLEHGGGIVHADDLFHVRRKGGEGLAGATAEIRDDEIIAQQREHRLLREIGAVELAAEFVPLSRRTREERFGVALPLAEQAIEAEPILFHGRPAVGL